MNPENQYFWNIDKIMKLLLGLAIGVGLLWLIYYLKDALLPFFVACVAAYILDPIVDLNQRIFHLKGRVIASLLTVLETTVVVFAICWVTVYSVSGNINQLSNILSELSSGKIHVPDGYVPVMNFIHRYLNPAQITNFLSSLRLESLLSHGTSLLEASAEVILHTVAWLLTFIYILFILIDYPSIVKGFKLIIPKKYRPATMEIVQDIRLGMNHYFRGQGKVALCAMVFYCVGFLIVGLPLAIPMGLLVGILYMIPYFQYITLIPVAAICFLYSLGGEFQFWHQFGLTLLVYLVSQSICDYIITPKVMGKELGLNPAMILLSLSVWGSLLGIIGMIIALPVTALLMQYYQKYISSRT